MKKGKISIGIIATVIAVALILLTIFNVFEKINTNISGLTDETANVNVTLGKTSITLNPAIIQTNMNNGFTASGKDLVAQAAELLGVKYKFGAKGNIQRFA